MEHNGNAILLEENKSNSDTELLSRRTMKQLLRDVEETNLTLQVGRKYSKMCLAPLIKGIFSGIGAAIGNYTLKRIFGVK